MKNRNQFKKAFSMAGLCLMLTATYGLGATQAATYTVDTTRDPTGLAAVGFDACTAAPGDCSLRGAIGKANAVFFDDTINFDASLLDTTIVLNGEIGISGNGSLSINGLGANHLTISGNGASRVFTVSSLAGSTTSISDLKMVNGYSSYGGALYNAGTLTLTNVTVSGSYAEYSGGIINYATLTLINSTVNGNLGFRYGGGIGNYGTLNLTNSTISGNSSNTYGGGIYNQTGLFSNVSAMVNSTHSTITGNSSYFGGGINTQYGGSFNINNTIVSGNSVSFPYGTADVYGSTFVSGG